MTPQQLHDLAKTHGNQLDALAERFDNFGSLKGWKRGNLLSLHHGEHIELIFEEGWVVIDHNWQVIDEGFLHTLENTK